VENRWGPVSRVACAVALSAAALAAIWAAPAGAAPAAPTPVELEQPSGRDFLARQFGDEWYHGYETRSGFTIVKERDTAVWRYAEKVEGGRLKPAGRRATASPPKRLRRHLRDRRKLSRGERLQFRGAADAEPSRSPSPANTGDQPVLVILAEFNDRTAQTQAAAWRGRFFGETNSVRNYWSEASYGALNLTAATESSGTANDGVVGWVQLNRAHPRNDPAANRQTARDAILAADPFVNYASYDANGNGKISASELHVVVIPAGYELAICGTASQPGVWGHQWSTYDYTPTVDGKQVGGANAHDGSYTMFGETHCDSSGGTWQATLGIMAHEIGHDIDLPDLYSSTGGTDGVGAWSVMAGGTWLNLAGQRPGETPSHPDAWSKYYQGWTNPQKLSGTHLLDTAATSSEVMRLGDNPNGVDWTFNVASGTGEYFLVENRQKTGYDAALPGCGLVIWHIDETRTSENTANATASRRLVDLEEADNSDFASNDSDPFANRSFSGSTTPNSNFYSGAASGLGVENIGGCAASMGGNFVQTGSTSPANDLFSNASTMSGAQGSLSGSNSGAGRETGEPDHNGNSAGSSVWYRWTAPRTGEVTIDTIGSGFDTVLAAYTGGAVGELTPVASNDDIGNGVTQSRVSFVATSGTTYRVAVDTYAGATPASGSVSLQWNQPIPAPGNDNFAAATVVSGASADLTSQSTEGATKEAGEPNHVGNAGGGSVWYRWTAPSNGDVVINTAGSNFDTLLAAYTGSAVNGLTQVAANDDSGGPTSSISFPATSGTTYRIAIDGYNDARGLAQLHLAHTAATPPDTSITAASPEATTTDTTAAFSFTATGNAGGFECKLDSAGWEGCSSPKSYSGLGVGSHTFSVRATGPGGPDPSPATHSWTVEAPVPPPPDTSITAAPVASTTATGAAFSFAASGESTGFDCKLDSGSWASCSSPKSYSGLSVGSHTFSVRAVGPGGSDASPATHSWTVVAPKPPPPDAVPETSILTGPPAQNVARRSFTAQLTFTASESATFTCRWDGGAWAPCTSPVSKKLLAPKRTRTYLFEVRATDAKGQVDATPAQHSFALKRKRKKRG
jgi:M6 family metalloprotease-like protein